ncbi:extracellular solute-binding protein [Shouchella patagoniensis]|uniref:extracellular solute-binding protein n=1 Tax=Shouchella patagoniensis TaxID=228576 RepID=UPI0009949A5B|nr:extracellular solute-binding protein [Shouchella patagoniensis]
MKKRWMLAASFAALAIAGCSGEEVEQKLDEEERIKNVNAEGFPIVNEAIDMELYTGQAPNNLQNYEERLIWKTYADLSNINVDFNEVPFDGLEEKVNLTLASGEYPDAFYSAGINSQQLTEYGAQGVFIKLDELIEEYAPNLTKLMEEYPQVRKGLTMADGHIYSFPSFYDPDFTSMVVGTPIWLNQHFLEELDMDEPTTIDEYYQYLKGVKEEELGIPYSGTSVDNFIMQIRGSWGLGTRGLAHKFIDINPETEELRFTRTDEHYKEVLEFVHQLWSEGLIDKDIYTMTSQEFYAKGEIGNIGSMMIYNPVTQMNQNAEAYEGMAALEGPYGDSFYTHVKAALVHVGSFVITEKMENPEAAVRWVDHFYGEEGALLQFMGVEGETFEVADDGSYEFTEEISNHPDGLTQDQAVAQHMTWLGGRVPSFVKSNYFTGSEGLPNAMEAGEKVKESIPEIWNYFNYTAEELQFKQSIGTDIETFILENEAAFVTGKNSFDEWEEYIEQVNNLGAEEYLAIEEAAYERYIKN